MKSAMKSAMDPQMSEHEWAAQVLPWWVNKTLATADVERLRAHLKVCDDCRRDLEVEEQLARTLAARAVVDYAPQASLAKLIKRLERSPMASLRRWWRRWQGIGAPAVERQRAAFSFVIAAQAAALIVLALALSWFVWKPSPEHEYYTLAGGPAPSLPHLQVVFDDKTAAADVLTILAHVRGRIIGGPSSAGVYLVAIDAAGEAALNSAARTLQSEPGVRFVAVVQAPPER